MSPIERYINLDSRRVQGWLDTQSARVIADLFAVQNDGRFAGGYGEIGIHRGKLLILMKLAARDAPGVAIDVFSDQHLNLDNSGCGDRDRFVKNLKLFTGSDAGVTIIQRSSLDVTPGEITSATGPCQIFSIDGGHTEECTLSDLRLTEAVLGEHGVAILDDCFNEEWPDVSVGLAHYILDGTTQLRPFAISPNKLYLARPSQHARLMVGLRAKAEARGDRIRVARMYQHTVMVIHDRNVVFGGTMTRQELVRRALWYPKEVMGQLVRRPGRVISQCLATLARGRVRR